MQILPQITIVGPTAVGKSAVALQLAQKLLKDGCCGTPISSVRIISADSRQVYRELAILTGADVPRAFQRQESSVGSMFQDSTRAIELYGVGCISIADEWSVAHFVRLAASVQKLPAAGPVAYIVVGGTGLYLQQSTEPAVTLMIPPDLKLREQLSTRSVVELQSQLATVAPDKLAAFNNSDRHNPRRLIRAIEVAAAAGQSSVYEEQLSTHTQPEKHNVIGIRAELPDLQQRIAIRVRNRIAQGAQAEVARVLDPDVQLSKQARSTVGLKELAAVLAGEVELEDAEARWAQRELQYAKRQLTWLKKYADAQWYSATSSKHLSSSVGVEETTRYEDGTAALVAKIWADFFC